MLQDEYIIKALCLFACLRLMWNSEAPENLWLLVIQWCCHPGQSVCVFLDKLFCKRSWQRALTPHSFYSQKLNWFPCFWWSLECDHLMSALPVSGWLLGKNKVADQEKGDSWLIHSMDPVLWVFSIFPLVSFIGNATVWAFIMMLITTQWIIFLHIECQ